MLAEGIDMLVDVALDRCDPARGISGRGIGVRRRNGAAKRVGERGVDTSGRGEVVEREALVEAAHLDRPFDRLPAPVERQPPVRLTRDRDDAAVDAGRGAAVDRKFGFAGGLALVERGVIEERKTDRAH